MIRLSICMMVKNEAQNMARCLESLKRVREAVESELIIIDTGSTDDTVAIAREYTEKVYYHEWNHDFSAMRNKSISYAKGQWLLIIDADEELTEDAGLIDFLKKNELRYSGAAIRLSNVMDAAGRMGPSLLTVRLFKNDGKDKYKGSVHNVPVIFGEVLEVGGLLLHYGYRCDDADLMERKFERTSALLMRELEKDPQNIYYRYQLGSSYDMHSDFEEACDTYERAYKDLYSSKEPLEAHLYLWGSYAKVLVSSEHYERAVEVVSDGLKVDADNIDLLYFGGLAYLNLKQMDKGFEMLQTYLSKVKVINELAIFRNPILQLFTINSESECYINLAQGYRLIENWAECMKYSKVVMEKNPEESSYYEVAVNLLARAAIEGKAYEEIHTLYAKHAQSRWASLDQIVYTLIEGRSINAQNQELFKNLAQTPAVLGQIISARMAGTEDVDVLKKAQLTGRVETAISRKWDEALLLALELKIDISQLLRDFEELDLMKLFSGLSEKYANLPQVVEEYLEVIAGRESVLDKNLKRVLSKYVALSSFGMELETERFEAYVLSGLDWLTSVYTKEFLDLMELRWLRNAEEQFLVCIWNIFNNTNADFIEATNLAAEVFPEWQKVYFRWLNAKFDQSNSQAPIGEKEQLLEALMKEIDVLRKDGKTSEVLDIVNAYLDIYPKDFSMIILKSEVLLEHIENEEQH